MHGYNTTICTVLGYFTKLYVETSLILLKMHQHLKNDFILFYSLLVHMIKVEDEQWAFNIGNGLTGKHNELEITLIKKRIPTKYTIDMARKET